MKKFRDLDSHSSSANISYTSTYMMTSPSYTLCVVGASGFVGSHVVQQALAKGWKVGYHAMSREFYDWKL